jgi:hypothetical protein
MTYSSITATQDDTPDSLFVTRKKPVSLRKIFGKVAACIAVAATLAFYGLGLNISNAYYQQWQENKAAVTQTWDGGGAARHDRTENLPWALAGGALALSYGAGFAGIALGRKKQGSSYGGSSYYDSGHHSSNDGFWWGYWAGGGGRSGGSSSSSSSSTKDNGGAAAAIVIVGAVALAVGGTVVSYKAVKANFTGEEPEEPQENPLSITPRRLPGNYRVPAP